AKIARAVQQAEASLNPARLSVGRGHEDTLAYNRRYHMKNGTVGWNPGKLNPNILKPAGPIDPEVAVVYFESLKQKPLVTYVNYAVHLDNVGGVQISADMPATVARLLAEVKGPDMVSLYTKGGLWRCQSYQCPLGRAPERVRERGAHGHHPGRGGIADPTP